MHGRDALVYSIVIQVFLGWEQGKAVVSFTGDGCTSEVSFDRGFTVYTHNPPTYLIQICANLQTRRYGQRGDGLLVLYQAHTQYQHQAHVPTY